MSTPIPLPSQIETAVQYHKRIVTTYEDFVNLLTDEVNNPNLDALTRARYKKELLEESDKLKYKQQALEMYLQRASAWAVEWEGKYKTMNEVFAATMEKAEAIQNKSANLEGVLNIWKTATDEARAGNEFRYRIWASLTQEIEVATPKSSFKKA